MQIVIFKSRFLVAGAMLAASNMFCAVALAGGLQSLEAFVKTVKSGEADFVQTVTSPPKEGQAARVRTSNGTFAFSRPNHFRFDYRKPFSQTIVADGKTLWLYDADLNQVTERKQAQALSSTPAALVASAQDMQALQAQFVLSEGSLRDGIEWVHAVPKTAEGQLQFIDVGFRDSMLVALEILDGFGQKSVMRFNSVKTNVPLGGQTFVFKPPAGADVVRQP